MEEKDSVLAVCARVFSVRCTPLWVYPNTVDHILLLILRMIYLLEVLKLRYTWMGARSFVVFHLQGLTIQQSGIITGKILPGLGFSMATASFICGESYRVTALTPYLTTSCLCDN